MWLALLLALVPDTTRLPPGPPVVHLERGLAVDLRLRSGPAWAAFAQRWGASSFARFDPRNGTPRLVAPPAAGSADIDDLVADIATLAGIAPAELTWASDNESGVQGRWFSRYTRQWRGVEVVGDEVLVVVQGDRVAAAWVRLSPVNQPDPRPGEVVVPLERGHGVLARVTRTAGAVRYTGRDGNTVLAYDPRRFDSVSVEHELLRPGDDATVDPARGVTVTDGSGASEVTGDDGAHGLSGPVSIELQGPELRLRQGLSDLSRPGEGDVVLSGGSDISWSAADTLHHYGQVYDWLDALWPTHLLLSTQVVASVDLSTGSCNAYYTDGTINFYAENDTCNATGRIASVVYHEVGHGIHHYLLAGGSFAGDVSEGSADFVSATILDDPEISAGFYVDGGSIREIDTDRRYPDDITGEVHNDGLVWASFLWNLREQWVAAYGEVTGAAMVDTLLLATLEQGPELTDLMEAVLVADDDNADWSDGTPHDCELIELLDHHGLGPGSIGVVTLEHAPLGPQASATEGYSLSVTTRRYFQHCADDGDPTVSAWITDDDSTPLPTAEGGWEAWAEHALSTGDGENWTTTLPRQPANSVIKYFLAVNAADGSEATYSHRDVDEDAWRAWVGDREALACHDLESSAGFIHGNGVPFLAVVDGQDDWSFGEPTGAYAYDPSGAYAGTGTVGNGLDAAYLANNANYLLTDTVDLSTPGLMRLFTYQRWITVEDARYDQARLFVTRDNVNYQGLWTNPATAGGSTQLLDTQWGVRDHDLSVLGDPLATDTAVRFAFTLQTDGGLEFGGWNLDDVCVVELDDVPGHYRRAGLAATWTDTDEVEVGEVSLSWTTPWINPLTATVLVRQEGAWPNATSDGVIVDLDLSPTWGEAKSAVDTLPGLERGTEWYYVLFAMGSSVDDVFGEAELGANAAMVGFPLRDTAPPLDTSVVDTGDTAAPPVDSDRWPEPAPQGDEETPAAACGCGTGGHPGWLGLLAVALARVRRRDPTPTPPRGSGPASGRPA